MARGKILASVLQPAGPQQASDPHLLVSGTNSREEMFNIPLTMKALFGKSPKHMEEMVVCRVMVEQVL